MVVQVSKSCALSPRAMHSRRYNNVVMDEERKMQADIFLGLKQRLYFPTLHLPYR